VGRCPDIDGNRVLDCDETLVENATFDRDTAGWLNEDDSELFWDDADAHEMGESGSLVVENRLSVEQDGLVLLGARQCVPLTGGAVYHLAAEISVHDDTSDTQGGLQLLLYDGPDCSGAIIAAVASSFLRASDWNVTSLTYVTPTETASAALRLVVMKPFDAPARRVAFDNVLLRTD
jgi:hypothetical protein